MRATVAGLLAYVAACACLVLDLAEEAQQHRTLSGGVVW